MTIYEYGVPNDFFQCEILSYRPDFPCCVCRNKEKGFTEYPCKFCGHNDSNVPFFNCTLCGEIIEGAYEDGNIIAKDTQAQIRGVCNTCFKIIEDSIGKC